jgi:quercetin dioxygenase-like cupin family protein
VSDLVVVPPGEGELLGNSSDRRVEVLSDDETVNATWTRFGPHREGADLHVHRHHTDFFYVLEGELTFQLRDELFTAGAGELAFAPRNVPHTYANLSNAPARALLVCTPAGFERYFDRIAARIAGVDPPPEASGPIPEVITDGPPIEKPDA